MCCPQPLLNRSTNINEKGGGHAPPFLYSPMSTEDILLEEIKKLGAQLESANYKINMLTIEVSSLKGTLEMVADGLRREKDKVREYEMGRKSN